MKKIFSFLLVLCAVCLAAEEYNFLALGDIHYDGAEYHVAPAPTVNRKYERERNIGMWTSGKSGAVLTAAADLAKVTKPAFVVQLGDFTQGDCDTKELQEKMFTDGFAKVKSFFPDKKLLAVKGNHDVRVTGVKGNCNEPAEKAFMPLIAKELGRENFVGGYTVRQGKDLFIFFDNFYSAKDGINFVKKALNDNKDARYVFFLTHLPVFPCSVSVPDWLIQGRTAISAMLAGRNAVVLCAHTHAPSFVSVSGADGNFSQMVVCSMGNQWNPDTAPAIRNDKYEQFISKSLSHKRAKPTRAGFFKKYEKYTVNEFNMYSGHSGFVVVNVDDNAVTADIYTGNSGKPWITKVLCKNAKTEDKK